MAISNINAGTTTYTIVRGDTLSEIAQRCIQVGMTGFVGKNPNTTGVAQLITLNPDIENRNLIYVGQVLTLHGSSKPKTKAVAQRAKITAFAIQSGTENTIFATWSWDKPTTTVEHYRVMWKYSTGDGVAWVGDDTTVTTKYSTYTIPENAIQVTFKVLPVSRTYKSKDGKKDLKYWTAEWSTESKYIVNRNVAPITPNSENFMDVLSIDPETNTLTATAIIKPAFVKAAVTTTGRKEPKSYLNGHSIQFEVRTGSGYIYKTGTYKIDKSTMDTSSNNTNTFIGDIVNGISDIKNRIGTFLGLTGNTLSTGTKTSIANSQSFSCVLMPGREYKIRYRIFRGVINYNNGTVNTSVGEYSDWYENNTSFSVALSELRGIKELYPYKTSDGQNAIRVYWYDAVLSDSNASIEGYTIAYTNILDNNGDPIWTNAETVSVDGNSVGYHDITGLVSETEYFFRIKADASTGDADDSPWTDSKSITISEVSSAPTTWSSLQAFKSGEDQQITLYWIHNSQTNLEYSAELDLLIKNDTINWTPVRIDESGTILNRRASDSYTMIIKPIDSETNLPSTGTSHFIIDGNNQSVQNRISDGAEFKWRVRTASLSAAYGSWSEYRIIKAYSPPNLTFRASVPVYENGEISDVELGLSQVINFGNPETSIDDSLLITPLLTFPIRMRAEVHDYTTQHPTAYHVTIISKNSYSKIDGVGQVSIINAGDVIYSRIYDTTKINMSYDDEELPFIITATDVQLENNMSYTLACRVVMSSGLSDDKTTDFSVSWADVDMVPDLEIGYDSTNYTMVLKPFCINEVDGALTTDTLLSIYRREFDGTYTELATNLDNEGEVYITDPHPSLDFARYRVVAQSETTGEIAYYDPPGYDINEKSVIIQWDEIWNNQFKYSDEADQDTPNWSGELLRLQYNIDISDNYSPEVELIEYIGRAHPVGYYGTQIGHTSTWNMAIPKGDSTTLYQLRKLSRWLGNVYVREPSGSGYLANVQVSFSQAHTELTIPITLTITRVEGE